MPIFTQTHHYEQVFSCQVFLRIDNDDAVERSGRILSS